jgi:hypothetical protein
MELELNRVVAYAVSNEERRKRFSILRLNIYYSLICTVHLAELKRRPALTIAIVAAPTSVFLPHPLKQFR